MINKFKSEPQWVFNFILSILVTIIFYTAMRMDNRIDLKADEKSLIQVCQRLDQKADISDLNRVDGGIQRQIENMTQEIRGLRSDLNTYFLGKGK